MHLLLDHDVFADFDNPRKVGFVPSGQGFWPAAWIRPAKGATVPGVTAYRLRFTLPAATSTRLHVSADEWCQLYLDGKHLGRLPDLSTPQHWFYRTLALDLPAGAHTLVALVFHQGSSRPVPVASVNPGLIVCPDPGSPLVPTFATGSADWQCKPLSGYTVAAGSWDRGACGDVDFDGPAFDWSALNGTGAGWGQVQAFEPGKSATRHFDGHPLTPSLIPPLLRRPVSGARVLHVSAVSSFEISALPFDPGAHLPAEAPAWQNFIDGQTLTIPAGTIRRVLIDLGEYYCGLPVFSADASGAAAIRFCYAEALRTKPFAGRTADGDWRNKIHRDRWTGLYFHGLADRYTLAADATEHAYQPYWWRVARYVEIVVQAGPAELKLSRYQWLETRYPLELESRIEADASLLRVLPFSVRALQSCAHETYMDCPYYEQAQWVGDMRPQILCHFVMTRDARLPRKGLLLASDSSLAGYLTRAFYPAKDGGCLIPSFALWLVATLHDYAWWRGDVDFVRSLMPTMRHNLELVLAHRGPDGLLRYMPGWNNFDWALGWDNGIPPHQDGVNGLWNWQLVTVLGQLAQLEEFVGEPLLARRAEELSANLARIATQAFWDESRGAMADTPEKKTFCEHAQCLAILSGRMDEARQARLGEALARPVGLTPCQPFFSHYVLEALTAVRRIEAVFERLGAWQKLVAEGLRTTPEVWEGTRSDCHAWSAHPVYHAFASIAGIRPAALGFARVRIAPQLGPLDKLHADLVHPAGTISLDVRRAGKRLTGTVELPAGLSGTFEDVTRSQPLQPGRQTVG